MAAQLPAAQRGRGEAASLEIPVQPTISHGQPKEGGPKGTSDVHSALAPVEATVGQPAAAAL
jgi:hypothetical protein